MFIKRNLNLCLFTATSPFCLIRRKVKARKERRLRRRTSARMMKVSIFCAADCGFLFTLLSLPVCFSCFSEPNVMRISLTDDERFHFHSAVMRRVILHVLGVQRLLFFWGKRPDLFLSEWCHRIVSIEVLVSVFGGINACVIITVCSSP